jgi:hypothetical protein
MVRTVAGWWVLTTLTPYGHRKARAGKVMAVHKHRFQTVRPYQFKDPASLVEDFWAEVDSVLKQKGVI